MDREELSAVIEWMESMRAGWFETATAIGTAAAAKKDFQVARALELKTRAPLAKMDSVQLTLRPN